MTIRTKFRMLRRKIPKLDLSPRIRSNLIQAAKPLPITTLHEVIHEACISSTSDMTPACGESWVDVIGNIEGLAGRKLNSKESAIFRTAIDTIAGQKDTKKRKRQLEDSAPGKPAYFYDDKFKQSVYVEASDAVREIVRVFAAQSDLIKDAAKIGRDPKLCLQMILASVLASVKSPVTVILYAKHTMAFFDFLEDRKIPASQRHGNASEFAIFDFLARRAGTTVPASMRCALRTFASALRIDWNLDTRAIAQVCEKPDRESKTAPLLSAEHIIFFETLAADTNAPFTKRLHAATFALMCHASLRYDDTLTIGSLSRDNTSITGDLVRPKVRSAAAKKFFCPLKGLANSEWSEPIFTFRSDQTIRNGAPPSFLFPLCSSLSGSITPGRGKKGFILIALRTLIKESGTPDPSAFSLHSPRNWCTSIASQLGWSKKAQTTLGRWGDNSNMPNRYNRANGSVELAIRSDIVDRIHDHGWRPSSKTSISDPPSCPSTYHYMRNQDAHLQAPSQKCSQG